MSTINDTPGNASSFRDLVESDKRSILEKLLETTLPKTKSTNADSPQCNGKNGSTIGTQASEYDTIFGEDIDDGDEVFENILKKAREEYEKEKELKKNYSNHQIMMDIFKKPAPKRRKKNAITGRTKAVERTITIMDEFKKKMMDSTEPSPQYITLPTITSSYNKDYNKFKSSVQIVSQGNQLGKRPYPNWKRTETYTPVFSVTTNPNWAMTDSKSAKPNILQDVYAPMQNKLYTPRHIDSWMEAVTTSHFTEPPSCKSIRSDVAVNNSSDSDEDSIKCIENSSIYFSPNYKNAASKIASTDYKTPPKTTTNSSTPMRSTTVRFRPSPPEYFVYGTDGNSSISSDSIIMEEYANNVLADSPPPHYDQCYQGHTKSSSMMQNSPVSFRNEYSPPKENIEYEEHHHYYSSGSLHNNILKKSSNDSKVNKPRFVEDFVRQLNHNISNNYNMEVKCSMKVKYYK